MEVTITLQEVNGEGDLAAIPFWAQALELLRRLSVWRLDDKHGRPAPPP